MDNRINEPMHRRISASFDIGSTSACFQTCLSNLQERFLIGNGLLQKFDILFDIEDFLENLNGEASRAPKYRANGYLLKVSLSLILRHLFFLNAVLEGHVHLIPL